MSRYDAKGQKWNRVKRKRKPGYPPKSTDLLQVKETIGIGLRARKFGLFGSSLTRASKPSSAVGVAANLENRTDKADRGGSGASEAEIRGGE